MVEIPVGEPLEVRIEEPAGSLEALRDADDRVDVARRYPACLAAWASLGEEALRDGQAVEAYAYFRVGYHRGLDRLRQNGWRGNARVPWEHPGNRGFLRCLSGLAEAAETIGEEGEAARCRGFVAELAPDRPSS